MNSRVLARIPRLPHNAPTCTLPYSSEPRYGVKKHHIPRHERSISSSDLPLVSGTTSNTKKKVANEHAP